MNECDFQEKDVRELETLLLEHSPQQLIRFFWSKDKRGEHGLEWFRPFFEHGWVKQTVFADRPQTLDEPFWDAYGWWCEVLAKEGLELSTFDLARIWTMSRDPRSMRVAYVRAKVKAPAYVEKVFEDEVAFVFSRTKPVKVDFEVGNSGGVKVNSL
jgi:hypothetical protein